MKAIACGVLGVVCIAALSADAEITLSQSTSTAIAAGNSTACHVESGPTKENSYYRRFHLADFGITQPFQVSSVDVGIESAVGGGDASQSVTIRLTDSSDFFAGPVATLNTSVSDRSATVLNFPIAAAIYSGDLIVEVFSPDGEAAGETFYIGSNAAGETAPGYIRAPTCSINTPSTTASLGYPNMHIVLIVHGSLKGYTDDPLTPGTPIKALHLTQLRDAVNEARAVAGKPAFSFTDQPPIAVKATHIIELRSALEEARSHLGYDPIAFTDAPLVPGTQVKAVHFQELRDAARVIVDGCQPITVTNPPQTSFTEGDAISMNFTQSGASKSAKFSIATGSLPSGLTLTNDGNLTGTAAPHGSYPVTVKATDFYGCSGTGATYNLFIHAAPPSISSFTATKSEFSGDSVTLTAVFSNGSAVITNDRDAGTIVPTSGTPVIVNPQSDTTYTLTVTNATADSVSTVAQVIVPAVVRINELNANLVGGCDLIELRVVSAGDMKDFKIQERTGNAGVFELNFTFPSFQVPKNAFIVVHMGGSSPTCNGAGASQELVTTVDQPFSTFPGNFDNAYDFWVSDAGLTSSDNVFTLFNTNGTMIDAVFASDDPAGTSAAPGTLSAAAAAGTANQWSPAQSTYTATEFRVNAVDDLNATSATRTGTSIQRINNSDTNSKSDWTTGAGSTSTWGALNPGQSNF